MNKDLTLSSDRSNDSAIGFEDLTLYTKLLKMIFMMRRTYCVNILH